MARRLPYIQGILGVWILVAPWALGFYEIAPAMWSSLISGAALILLALWQNNKDKLDEVIQ